MNDFNSYEDAKRAEAYARLEFPGTYYLAYRDLPEIIGKYVVGDDGESGGGTGDGIIGKGGESGGGTGDGIMGDGGESGGGTGNKALDFGCGTGRSTRFLQKLGFDTIGVDISDDMLKLARETDPAGKYLKVADGVFDALENNRFDLVLSSFTFDNIPTFDKKVKNFKEIARVLKNDGSIISIVSSPEIYTHEWASFSTKYYPENKNARCGDTVKIIITAIEDSRPVEDIVWPDADYQDVYYESGLVEVEKREPPAVGDEPYEWINETTIAPWVIYVLKKKDTV